MPAEDIRLRMVAAAQVTVTVDFTGMDRRGGYIVNLEPEGGSAVGKWSGSGNIDEKNPLVFRNIPPGKYIVFGHPNPSTESQKTAPITADLQGGQQLDISLKAK
jgi:hypothetical protein